MKKVIVYFLLSLLLMQNSGKWIILAWFSINQPYIARTLCENRSRPQLHCDGQCVLAKKLKAADERAARDLAQWQQLLEVVPFTPPITADFSFASVSTIWIATAFPVYSSRAYADPSFDFFHPPCS
ncbi:hypothetical protein GCM10023189_61000 [Nibrella saemangeumensis]|uniref:Secreted protein n=1 Tax=Nibrella saemangeumensis TaxID=1084526 RepID=A0ABP8NUB9_9BACT